MAMHKDISRRAMELIGSSGSLVVHTLFFIGSFALVLFGAPLDKVLLVVTTLVSLEAIYLAIFIQMAVNQNTQSLEEVEEDLGEIQEDVEEIEENIDEIQEDVEEIQEEDAEEEAQEEQSAVILERVGQQLQELSREIERLKNNDHRTNLT